MSNFKFPSIKEPYCNETIIDKGVYVFEKVDGANVSIRKNMNHIAGWSRGAPIGNSKKYYFDQFRRFLYDYLNPEIFDLPKDFIIFGEFTHKGYGHILYDEENLNKFFMIGIYDQSKSKFLHPKESQYWIELMGLDKKIKSIPLLSEGKVNPLIIEEALEKSKLYSGVPEGVVVHQYSDEFQNGLRFSKIYHSDFVETDSKKKGVEKYVTKRRLIKVGQNSISHLNGNFTPHSIIERTIEDVLNETKLSKSETAKLRSILNRKASYIRTEVMPLFFEKENFLI